MLDRMLQKGGARQGRHNQYARGAMPLKLHLRNASPPGNTSCASQAKHDAWMWQKSGGILAGKWKDMKERDESDPSALSEESVNGGVQVQRVGGSGADIHQRGAGGSDVGRDECGVGIQVSELCASIVDYGV